MGFRLSAAFALLLAFAGGARAEDKKPGMFDFETWKSPVARQRDATRWLAPVPMDLTPAGPHASEPRPIHVRVYADDDYRRLVVRWQSRLRAQFERINGVAGPVFGAGFQIESIREWKGSHAGAGLGAMISDLQALDAGREVDLVVGLVTPARGVVTDLHQVGMAATPGRHLVVRGMDDEQESLAIDREFSLLSPAERLALYDQRRLHKEVVVVLHKWGHVMGLLHEEDRASIMNPAYDRLQSRFSDFAKQVVASTLEQRFAHPGEALPEAGLLVALIEKAPSDFGSEKERAKLLASLRGQPPARAAGARPVDVGLDAGLDGAARALEAGRPEEAWKVLAPAIDRVRATADARTWTRIADLAASAGALTAADEAIGHVPRGGAEIEKVAASAEATRQRVALPPNGRGGVAADREPAYVAGYLETSRLISSGDAAGAQARFQQMARDFPDTPAVDLLACELELRAGHAAAATRKCEAVLAKYRFAVRAHVLLGVAAARSGRAAVAVEHLETAIRLDPRDSSTWRTLADVYQAQRARTQRAQLAARYRALFGAPLP